MDLSRLHRDLAGARDSALEYDVLLALLDAAQRRAGGAAAAAAKHPAENGWRGLAAIVLALPGWRDAARARGGAFAPAHARAAANRMETEITSPFTLAFQPSLKRPR